MLGGIKRLIAMTIFALTCASMWGCGLFEEDVTHEVHEKRHSGLVIAILDDSLALETNGRGWTDHTESCDYWENCDGGTINQGLFLVNYRNKQRPLWGDTIDGVITIIWGLAADSTVLFYDKKNNFGFWKVGKNIDVRKKMKWEDGCKLEHRYVVVMARPWKDGNVLLKDADPCPYAVLDTATGIVRKLEFTGEYAWLEGCDDITYIDGDVVCLKALYDEKRYGVYEYGKNGLMDSLIWNDASWSIYTENVLEIRGNMFTIKHPTKMIDGKPNPLNGTFIHYLKPLGTPALPVRMEYNNFVDSTGTSVGYSADDLIITK